MTTNHSLQTFYAGDDWQINGTLYDVDGNLMDLTGAAIEWALLDAAGNVILDGMSSTVEVMSTGRIAISVSDGVSDSVAPGQYSDVLRVTISAFTDTMWAGPILVKKGL